MYSVNFVFCVQISYFADIISGLSWGKYDIWTKKINFVSCRVRTGDLVRVKHT